MNINATLFGQTIAFFIFVWFCMKFIWPPIMNALNNRKQTIADGLAAAERGQKEQKLAEQRAKDILLETKDQTAEIIARAEKRAGEIVEEAKEGHLNKEELEGLHLSIGINHSVVEDPALFLALGLNAFWLWVPRLITAMLAVRLLSLWQYSFGKRQASKSS